jgi:uncharacterized protein YlaI
MSEYSVEILEAKGEPIDMYEESNKENLAAPQSNPPSSDEGVAADGQSVVKQLKKKAKRSAMAGSFLCLICNKEYVYEAFLTRHMVSKHRACEPIHQYRCRQCGAIFADEAGFEKHKSLFFDFLRHHLERVKPKELEQENEVTQFEEFVKATAVEKTEEDGHEHASGMDESIQREEDALDR